MSCSIRPFPSAPVLGPLGLCPWSIKIRIAIRISHPLTVYAMRLDAVRTVVYPKGTGGMDMNLCMKQKVFSWGDRFTVWDENGNDRYYVRGEMFSLGKKLHLTDTAGAEVAFIQQKAFSFRPRFYVYMNGALQAEIVKDFTFLRSATAWRA